MGTGENKPELMSDKTDQKKKGGKIYRQLQRFQTCEQEKTEFCHKTQISGGDRSMLTAK